MKLSRLDLLLAGAVALGAGGVALLWRARRRHDSAAAERKRRQHVGRVGRITLGEILEVMESAPEAPASPRRAQASALELAEPIPPRRLALYRYTVAGVAYETAQDLSELWNDLAIPRPGQLASVKYDPANPSNSVLAAENWPGVNARGPGVDGGKGP